MLRCCSKLRGLLGADIGRLWDVPFCEDTVAAAGLTEAEAAVWVGPARMAVTSTHVKIRSYSFRTSAYERNMVSRDSGIAGTFSVANGYEKYYGILQSIWQVNIGGMEMVLLQVDWFRQRKTASEGDLMPGRVWVKSSGHLLYTAYTESLIAAEQVDCQVFYADDPEMPGYLHVFEYLSSGYMIPEHHYDHLGRLLDL